MSEAAATIIKNVYQFAKILSQASSHGVRKWDFLSICNALDWADYCEELYLKLKGQHVERAFNAQLAQMTIMLQPVSCLCLSLDTLQHAKDLLVNTLMCNPELSVQLCARLTSELNKTSSGNEILCTVHEQKSRLKKAGELHSSILSLAPCNSSVTSGDRCKVRFQADFLVQHLVKVASTARKKDRFKNYCHDLCDKLAQSLDGQNILINIFKLKTDGLDPEEFTHVDLILGHLLCWLQGQFLSDPQASLFVKADAKDLSAVASTCKQFFSLYLEALCAWADFFQPELRGAGCLTWRSGTGHDCQVLTSHCEQLLSSCHLDDKAKVIQIITDQVQAGGFTVWRRVAHQLLYLLMASENPGA